MANLAKCGDCAALTLNTDDDISRHRLWHKDWDAKFRNTRTAAIEARDALGGLRSDIASYSSQLSQQPIIEPEQITVEDFPEDDDPDSTYAEDDVAATIANPTAGEPTEDAADAADAPTAVNDAISNLYTPRA